MSIEKPLLTFTLASLFLWPACIDWSVQDPTVMGVDCSLYNNAGQRYPGLCGLDAMPPPPGDGGAIGDGGGVSDGGDGGVSHGD